jgi:hypothetical protein
MKAPYWVMGPTREGDWWGVYGPNGIEKAFRFQGQAQAYCNELNYEAGWHDAHGG